jgi:hypothetical protein
MANTVALTLPPGVQSGTLFARAVAILVDRCALVTTEAFLGRSD